MEQALKLKALSALVLHLHGRLQRTLPKCDAENQPKFKRPLGSRRRVQHCATQPEVQPYAAISLILEALTRAAAQKLPVVISSETVLREALCGVVFRRCAEDGEDERDAAADGLGAVEFGGGGQEYLLGAGRGGSP